MNILSSALMGLSALCLVMALPVNGARVISGLRRLQAHSAKEMLLTLAQALSPWVARWAVNQPELQVRLLVAGWRKPIDEATWLAYRLLVGLMSGLTCALLAMVSSLEMFWWLVPISFGLGAHWPVHRLKVTLASEYQAAERGFPVFLDGLALALEGGQSFAAALSVAAERLSVRGGRSWGRVLQRAASDIRQNRGKTEALELLRMALPIPAAEQFVATVLSAEQSGLSLGRILRDQSSQARRYFQLSMEKRAQEAPVKLLGPLMVCIFPCTFIILFSPLAFRLAEQFS
jgi:tight adherence protein C